MFNYVNSLELSPITISSGNDVSISVGNSVNLRSTHIYEKIKGGKIGLDDPKAWKLSEEIFLLSDLENEKSKKTRWTIDIENTIGKLKVLEINIEVQRDIIYLNIRDITFIQPIPTITVPKVVCARTGDREFLGIAGPREMECKTTYPTRGLNEVEIEQIRKALLDKKDNYYKNKLN